MIRSDLKSFFSADPSAEKKGIIKDEQHHSAVQKLRMEF